jgi:hypothetical protein
MKLALMALLLRVSLCYGRKQGDFELATSNAMDAQHPRVNKQKYSF